jgi:hypothetical protein
VGETHHDVHGEVRLHLEELAMIDDHADDVLDVVRLFGVVRNHGGEARRGALRVVGCGQCRRLLVAVLRDVLEHSPHLGEAFILGFGEKMRYARLDVVHLCTSEGVERHLLTGRDAYHFWSGDEHVADAVDHEREISHSRRVDRPSGARPKDQAQLRDEPAGFDVAPEDLGITRKRNHALLDAGATRVVDADDGDPVAKREVHNLDDLFREHLPEGAAEHRGVVAEQHHIAAVDLSHPGDDTVSGNALCLHVRALVAMGGEDVELLERVAVDKTRYALARGQLAFRVLPVERLGVSVASLVFALPQLVQRIDLLGFGFGHWSPAFSSNIQRCPFPSS